MDHQTKPNFRQVGRQLVGKLAKGPTQDPIGKNSASAIPYKFETILYRNTNPKGFGTSAQRANRTDDLSPGPGSYEYGHVYSNSDSASLSKKGYGNGFVSRAHRLLYRNYINTGPGPGAYTFVEDPFKVNHIIHNQKKELPEELLRSKSMQAELPGPGYYNPDISKTSQTGNPKVIKSSFKSSTIRNISPEVHNPPPGTYEIDRSLSEKKPFKHLLNSANFMTPSPKKLGKEAEERRMVNNLLGKSEDADKSVPGPGYYLNPNDDSILISQRYHHNYSSSFVPSSVSRFGEVLDPKARKYENPGPGQYTPELPGTNQEKAFVSGSVFMSESTRNPFGDIKHFVGPTRYNPEPLPKKSHHLNINKRWV